MTDGESTPPGPDNPAIASGKQGRLLHEQWAVDVRVRSAEIHRYATMTAGGARPGVDSERRTAVLAAVEELLSIADGAVRRSSRWPRGLVDRWRGTSVVLAYQSVHAAEVFLVELLDDEQLEVMVPGIVARARAVFDPTDPRRMAVERLPEMAAERARGVRAAIKQAIAVGFDVTDQMHVRVRNFRNLLIMSAVLIMVLMAGLVWLVALSPAAMPMCFAQSSATVPSEEMLNICPSGVKHPSGGDVLIVAGLGLLGGALAAAFSIRNVRGTSTPYDVPVALALLKPPLGALTAVSSIVLLGGEFVPGLSQLDSQRQILAYALVFGYAQQLVSRLIDNQGHAILNSLPSKDPAARRPAGSTPPPPTPRAPVATGQRLGGVRGRRRLP